MFSNDIKILFKQYLPVMILIFVAFFSVSLLYYASNTVFFLFIPIPDNIHRIIKSIDSNHLYWIGSSILLIASIIYLIITIKIQPLRNKSILEHNPNKKALKFKYKKISIGILISIFTSGTIYLFYALSIQKSFTNLNIIIWIISLIAILACLYFIENKQLALSKPLINSKELFFLCSALFLFAVLSLLHLSIIPSHYSGDELLITDMARAISKGVYLNIFEPSKFCSIPVPGFFLKVISIQWLGFNLFSSRLPSAILSLVLLIPFYFMLRYMFNFYIAMFSIMILATSPYFILYSRLALFPIQVLFFFIVSLFFVVLSLKEDNNIYLILAGISSGLAAYSWGASLVILVSISFYLFYLFLYFKNKRLKLFLCGLVIVFSFVMTICPLYFSKFEKHPNKIAFDSAVYARTILNKNTIAMYKKKYKTDSYFMIALGQAFTAFKTFSCRNAENGLPHATLVNFVLLLFALVSFPFLHKKNPYLALIVICFLCVVIFGGFLSDNFSRKRMLLTAPFIAILSSISIYQIILLIRTFKLSKKAKQALTGLTGFLLIGCIITMNLYSFFKVLSPNINQRHYFILANGIKHFKEKCNIYIVNIKDDNYYLKLPYKTTDRDLHLKTSINKFFFDNKLDFQTIELEPGKLPITKEINKHALFIFNKDNDYYKLNLLNQLYDGNFYLVYKHYRASTLVYGFFLVKKAEINKKIATQNLRPAED